MFDIQEFIGLLDEILPVSSDTPVSYASAEDVMTVSDHLERNVTIRRWHKNGKPLHLRVRGLDLDQQDRINQAALVRNPKTQVWEQSVAAHSAATLLEALVVPSLDAEQAKAMRKRNPVIIDKLVTFIWRLAALDDETIERYARIIANPPPDPTAAADDATGGEN